MLLINVFGLSNFGELYHLCDTNNVPYYVDNVDKYVYKCAVIAKQWSVDTQRALLWSSGVDSSDERTTLPLIKICNTK